MVQVLDNPRNIPDAVAIRVGERPGIDLVEDPGCTLASASRFTTGKTTLMALFVTPLALVLARSTGVAPLAAAGSARAS
jgi:hypothetical protein